MKRRTKYYETFDGVEVELGFEALEGAFLHAGVGDKLIVAYLVGDYDGHGCNPLKDHDCNGELHTGDDALRHLGLESFGSSRSYFEPDRESAEIEKHMHAVLRERIATDKALAAWCVQYRMENDADPFDAIIEGDFDVDPLWREAWPREAWQSLYLSGEMGWPILVYRSDSSIYVVDDPDDANAVWMPCKCALENIDCTPYPSAIEKMAAVRKYAEQVLSEYEKWANGEVYGCVVQTHEADGKLIESDECWGFIGDERAAEALRDEFFWPACERNKEKETA
jgi:hypothetical protein